MLEKIKNNPKLLEFIRFVIVGVGATILHYGIYLTLEHGLHFNYNLAYTLGYILSFIFNFFASTFFTFKTEANAQNGFKFASAHLINYFVHMFLLNIFIFIGIPDGIAPIFVFPIAIILNFFMVRFALKK
ncbi:GtrA family protein [Turicibacter bilis]|uniref:GtrA family protein n=1 Tax=Turicibacter bilis TaxID=2735723 RepID=A0ABY5JK65_9FIRM|nr:GtrA family protein [Turicibacter bilis]MBS3200340.1 GtrA family protein [Turicibacter bilis]UUF07063.1 GtrA family protein [Turicibacter bilis]